MSGIVSVKEKRIQMKISPLSVSFCALLAWKASFVRFSFYAVDRTGLGGGENIVFIVLCLGYALGVLASGFFGVRFRGKETAGRAPFYIAVALAILCTAMSANTWRMTSLLFTFLAALFSAFATGRCLQSAMMLRKRGIGLFVGVSLAISEGVMALLFLQPFYVLPVGGMTVALCILLSVAGVAYRPAHTEAEPAGDSEPPPQGKTLLRFVIVLFAYCCIAGILDNLYAFEGIFGAIPHFLRYIYLYSIVVNLLAGYLFDKINWRTSVPAAIVLICMGQYLSFFASIEVLAIPYIALTTLGMVAMEVCTIALPVYYARDMKRPGLACCMGLFAQYLGYGASSILFEFIPRGRYLFVLGIVLAAALAVMMLLYITSKEYETERAVARVKQMARESGDSLADGLVAVFERRANALMPDNSENLELSPREKEVAVYLLRGLTSRQISSAMGIAESTVNKYCGTLYKKLGINSRMELSLRFGAANAMAPNRKLQHK